MDDLSYADRYEEHPEEVLKGVFVVHMSRSLKSLYPNDARRAGWYSFRPDDFEDCHNCVTWAVDTINEATGISVLSRPHQGRVKDMVKILQTLGTPSVE